MKKYLLLSLLTAAIVFSTVTDSFTKKTQPPTAKTGAPSESTCGSTATGCHNTTPNTGSGTLTVDFGGTTYSWGQVLTGTVTTSEAGKVKFGFEGTMLDNTNSAAGTWAIIDATTTTIQTGGSRKYIGHKNASANNTWSFTWTAPNPATGPVTFYLASICGDGDDHSTNDHAYTTSIVIEPLFNAISEVTEENNYLVIENSIADNFSLKYFSSPENETLIRLIDINGRVINTLVNGKQSAGTHLLYWTKPAVSGLYFVEYLSGNNREVKKLIVL